jgi:hypothetical protein
MGRALFWEALGELQILRTFTQTTLPMLAFASVFAGLVLACTRLGFRVATQYQWPLFLVASFDTVTLANESAFDGFLSAVVGATGAFLALYLANLRSVTSSVYVNKPGRLRYLLIQEKASNAYVRFLIFLTLIALIFLLVGVIYNYRPRTVLLAVGLLGLVSIRAFFELGKYALRFFDPTVFADTLFGELGRWSRSATVKGARWHDPSFQNHYRSRANAAIQGLGALVAVAIEEPTLRRESLRLLLSKLLLVLELYTPRKRHIPTTSLWYERTHKHKRWYTAHVQEVDLASRTQTELRPEDVPNQRWVEEALIQHILRGLNDCPEGERLSIATVMLDGASSYFEILGREWDIVYGRSLLTTLSERMRQGSYVERHSSAGDESTLIPALVERLTLLPISLMLGFVHELEEFDPEGVWSGLQKLDWRDRTGIYRLNVPMMALETLEEMQQKLLFELDAENRVITQHWYQRQLFALKLAEVLDRQVDSLIRLVSDFYIPELQTNRESGNELAAVVTISSGLNFCNKALAHFEKLPRIAESLDAACIWPEPNWPNWDWEGKQNSLIEGQRRLILALAESIPNLSVLPESQRVPDYFGMAVHRTGEWTFRALLLGDVGLFEELFTSYFNGALRLRDKLRDIWVGDGVEDALPWFLEPLVDLCDLSGYAYLLAEIHNEPKLWLFTKAHWELFFQRAEQGIELIAGTITYNRFLFGAGHRALLRARWKMEVDQLITTLPRKRLQDVAPDGALPPIPDYVEIVAHPSPLVQLVAGTGSWYPSSYVGIDFFTDLYLRIRPDLGSIDFGRKDHLGESLARWKRNATRYHHEFENGIREEEE